MGICPFLSQTTTLQNCIEDQCMLWDEVREACGVANTSFQASALFLQNHTHEAHSHLVPHLRDNMTIQGTDSTEPQTQTLSIINHIHDAHHHRIEHQTANKAIQGTSSTEPVLEDLVRQIDTLNDHVHDAHRHETQHPVTDFSSKGDTSLEPVMRELVTLIKNLQHHVHGAHFHPKWHDVMNITVDDGDFFTGKMPYAPTLVQEYVCLEDGDSNGKIYGKDFMFDLAFETPIMFVNLQGDPEFKQDLRKIKWWDLYNWRRGSGADPLNP